MSYKIIFLDIDGTLTNAEKKVTPATKKALFEAQEKADESAQKQDDEQSEVSQAAETANVQIETRFAQKKAEQLLSRAGASVQQSGELFTSGNLAACSPICVLP